MLVPSQKLRHTVILAGLRRSGSLLFEQAVPDGLPHRLPRRGGRPRVRQRRQHLQEPVRAGKDHLRVRINDELILKR